MKKLNPRFQNSMTLFATNINASLSLIISYSNNCKFIKANLGRWEKINEKKKVKV